MLPVELLNEDTDEVLDEMTELEELTELDEMLLVLIALDELLLLVELLLEELLLFDGAEDQDELVSPDQLGFPIIESFEKLGTSPPYPGFLV